MRDNTNILRRTVESITHLENSTVCNTLSSKALDLIALLSTPDINELLRKPSVRDISFSEVEILCNEINSIESEERYNRIIVEDIIRKMRPMEGVNIFGVQEVII